MPREHATLDHSELVKPCIIYRCTVIALDDELLGMLKNAVLTQRIQSASGPHLDAEAARLRAEVCTVKELIDSLEAQRAQITDPEFDFDVQKQRAKCGRLEAEYSQAQKRTREMIEDQRDQCWDMLEVFDKVLVEGRVLPPVDETPVTTAMPFAMPFAMESVQESDACGKQAKMEPCCNSHAPKSTCGTSADGRVGVVPQRCGRKPDSRHCTHADQVQANGATSGGCRPRSPCSLAHNHTVRSKSTKRVSAQNRPKRAVKRHEWKVSGTDHSINTQPPEAIESESPEVTALRLDFHDKVDFHFLACTNLDLRHDQFSKEIAEYFDKLAAGEDVEPREELDLRQLKRTFQLTRNVSDHEQRLEALRDQLQEAGISEPTDRLGSRPGYRGSDAGSMCLQGASLSPGQQIRKKQWRQRLQSWVDNIGRHGTIRSQPPIPESTSTPDLDEWEAKSITVNEAWTSVAAGTTRKRIDRWRAMCAAARENISASRQRS